MWIYQHHYQHYTSHYISLTKKSSEITWLLIESPPPISLKSNTGDYKRPTSVQNHMTLLHLPTSKSVRKLYVLCISANLHQYNNLVYNISDIDRNKTFLLLLYTTCDRSYWDQLLITLLVFFMHERADNLCFCVDSPTPLMNSALLGKFVEFYCPINGSITDNTTYKH